MPFKGVYVPVFERTFVRLYVCTPVRLYACTFVRLHVCTPARLYACTFVRLYVCTPVRVYRQTKKPTEIALLFKWKELIICRILTDKKRKRKRPKEQVKLNHFSPDR